MRYGYDDERRFDLCKRIAKARSYEQVWPDILELHFMIYGSTPVEVAMAQDPEVMSFLCDLQRYADWLDRANTASMLYVVETGSLFYPIEYSDEFLTDGGMFDPSHFLMDTDGTPIYQNGEGDLVARMIRLHQRYFGW